MKRDNTTIWIIAVIAVVAILFLGPKAGLFTFMDDIEMEYECPPGWTFNETPSPCEGAVWEDTPVCLWDITGCEDYCDEDADCIISVPAPNTCKMDWKPHNVSKIGYCKFNFCKWQSIPGEGEECSTFKLFMQKYIGWLFRW